MTQCLHFLTGLEFSQEEISGLLNQALALKKGKNHTLELQGKQLALLFEKPSLRTRFSFTAAMRGLGGDVIESVEGSRKTETPEDTARVLAGYCDAIMLRTHDDANLERMRAISSIPIINGLSYLHHPCQALADLLTLQEIHGHLAGLTLCYIGDGNNVLHSLLLLGTQLGVDIHYCCPAGRGPAASILQQLSGHYQAFDDPATAVIGADAVYTDVWTSMGCDNADHLFEGMQVSEALMQKAKPNAIFMHCMPMVRGKEISETLADHKNSVVFLQSENRLHAQKALLLYLLKGE